MKTPQPQQKNERICKTNQSYKTTPIIKQSSDSNTFKTNSLKQTINSNIHFMEGNAETYLRKLLAEINTTL
jgi:hypothetical protein